MSLNFNINQSPAMAKINYDKISVCGGLYGFVVRKVGCLLCYESE